MRYVRLGWFLATALATALVMAAAVGADVVIYVAEQGETSDGNIPRNQSNLRKTRKRTKMITSDD